MAIKRPQIRAREGGRCAVDGLPGADAHHRWMTGQGGPSTWPNQIYLCRACHDWAHHHPGAAMILGLILPPDPEPAPALVAVPYFAPPDAPWASWALLAPDTDTIRSLSPGPRWDEGRPPLTPKDWLAAR